ncbi:hypothetical protein BJF86_15550 [Serinicoccus sp. CNJ-927]|nr:hypothetical protein BJF86_15550 [Serinicoccus sp. CNJ-927]
MWVACTDLADAFGPGQGLRDALCLFRVCHGPCFPVESRLLTCSPERERALRQRCSWTGVDAFDDIGGAGDSLSGCRDGTYGYDPFDEGRRRFVGNPHHRGDTESLPLTPVRGIPLLHSRDDLLCHRVSLDVGAP